MIASGTLFRKNRTGDRAAMDGPPFSLPRSPEYVRSEGLSYTHSFLQNGGDGLFDYSAVSSVSTGVPINMYPVPQIVFRKRG